MNKKLLIQGIVMVMPIFALFIWLGVSDIFIWEESVIGTGLAITGIVGGFNIGRAFHE